MVERIQVEPTFPKHIRVLTALRFFAAVWVLLFHLNEYTGHAFGSVVAKGHLGVDFFFILSGWVLTHQYLRAFETQSFSFRQFLINRIARIYPIHVFVLAVNVLLLAALTAAGLLPQAPDWQQLPAVVLLLHAWGVLDGLDWNDPSWSISAEWFAYVAFPVFLTAASLFKRPVLLALAALAMFAGFYSLLPHVLGARMTSLTYDYGILRIIPEFWMGIALYILGANRGRLSPRLAPWAVPASVVTLITAAALSAPDWILILNVAALVYGAAQAERSGARVLGSSHFQYLGEISYSIYINHFLVLYVFFGAAEILFGIPIHGAPVWLCLPPMLIAISVSMLTYEWIEVPARRWIRHHSTVLVSPAKA
jgi:peptidoglycan/LPS O-acetylase OafA/YrhL